MTMSEFEYGRDCMRGRQQGLSFDMRNGSWADARAQQNVHRPPELVGLARAKHLREMARGWRETACKMEAEAKQIEEAERALTAEYGPKITP